VRQIEDGVLREDPGDDPLRPAVQVPRHVLQRLALADGAVSVDRMAAQLLDGEIEGHAGTQRGLLEEQAQGAAGKRAGVTGWLGLELSGQVQQTGDLVGGQVQVVGKVPGRRFEERLSERGGLHGGSLLQRRVNDYALY
jgi:hypothetical protein